MNLTGEYLPMDSIIHHMDARTKIICFLIYLAAVVMAKSAVGYLCLSVFIFIVIFLSHLHFRDVLSNVRQTGTFLLIIFVMNAFFFKNQNAIWSFWFFHLTWKGIVQGFDVVLKVSLLIIGTSILTESTPPMQITSAMEALMAPLSWMGIPVEDLALMISVAIQFIPVIAGETEMIMKAQKARGANFDSPQLLEKAQAVMPLVIPVFISAFQRADELAAAMEARGYRGGKNRTKKVYPSLGWSDAVWIGIVCLVCAVAIIF